MDSLHVSYDIIPFNSLSPSILYDILALREEVFTFEQKCTLPDLDFLDKKAIHIISTFHSVVCAIVRILPPVVYQHNAASFGRMAVKKSFRKKGLGRQLIKKSIDYINAHYLTSPIEISAQARLKTFYKSFGFQSAGLPYDEGGIAHVKMCYNQHKK